MKRIRGIRWLLLGIAAVAVILIVTISSRRANLVWYRTPILTAGGHRVRIALLAPGGWEVGQWGPPYRNAKGRFLRMWPHETRRFLPDSIRRPLGLTIEGYAAITIMYVDGIRDAPVRAGDPNYGSRIAVRDIAAAPGFRVFYGRDNKAEFDANYREILSSVRVEEVRE